MMAQGRGLLTCEEFVCTALGSIVWQTARLLIVTASPEAGRDALCPMQASATAAM